MPAWVRKSIQKRSYHLTSATATQIAETDPAAINEIAAADSQKGFLNIESLTTTGTLTLDLYRWEGARGDLLRRIDPSGTPYASYTATGVFKIDWPSDVAGAARRVTIDGKDSASAGTVIFELDDVFRTTGG